MARQIYGFSAMLGLALLAAVVTPASPVRAAAEESQSAALPALSSQDAKDLERVESYLRGLTTLRARFVQVSSLGDSAEGELVLDRPGRARFDYDPPTPVLMIARNGLLLYYNKELKQASYLPLDSTPLRFLTDGDLSLSRDAQVLGIERQGTTLAVRLAEKGHADDGRLTLLFSDSPLTLRQWIIVDPQGTTVRVALLDPVFGAAVDPSLFDYSGLDTHGLDAGQHGR